jgi:hypothetical protein
MCRSTFAEGFGTTGQPGPWVEEDCRAFLEEGRRDGDARPRKLLEQDQKPHVHHVGPLVLLRIRGPHVRGSAQQHRDTNFRLPARLLHASQGSLIAFVIMLFWFARKQNEIDEEHGVAED